MSHLVSVIIPIYNAEKFLEKCIDSVIKQTYHFIEIILVNDGSTDSSLIICNQYALTDKRIKIINKENSGPSIARHDGFKIAKGFFVLFIDADDYIDREMINIMMKEIKPGTQILQCSYRIAKISGEIIKTVSLKNQEYIGEFTCAFHYISQKNTTNYLWNKLIRRSLLNQVVFPNFYAGEDSSLLIQAYSISHEVITIDKVLYTYVENPVSLTRTNFSIKKLDNIKSALFIYDYLIEKHPNLLGFASLNICSYASRLYCEISLSSDLSLKKYKIPMYELFYKFYKQTTPKAITKVSSIKRILFVRLFNFSPIITIFFYKQIYRNLFQFLGNNSK
jgi:glycosyltransferase involved in cell wall biosynthesis